MEPPSKLGFSRVNAQGKRSLEAEPGPVAGPLCPTARTAARNLPVRLGAENL